MWESRRNLRARVSILLQAAKRDQDDGATRSLELEERFYARPVDIFEVCLLPLPCGPRYFLIRACNAAELQ